jgi:hypothetical protein
MSLSRIDNNGGGGVDIEDDFFSTVWQDLLFFGVELVGRAEHGDVAIGLTVPLTTIPNAVHHNVHFEGVSIDNFTVGMEMSGPGRYQDIVFDGSMSNVLSACYSRPDVAAPGGPAAMTISGTFRNCNSASAGYAISIQDDHADGWVLQDIALRQPPSRSGGATIRLADGISNFTLHNVNAYHYCNPLPGQDGNGCHTAELVVHLPSDVEYSGRYPTLTGIIPNAVNTLAGVLPAPLPPGDSALYFCAINDPADGFDNLGCAKAPPP